MKISKFRKIIFFEEKNLKNFSVSNFQNRFSSRKIINFCSGFFLARYGYGHLISGLYARTQQKLQEGLATLCENWSIWQLVIFLPWALHMHTRCENNNSDMGVRIWSWEEDIEAIARSRSFSGHEILIFSKLGFLIFRFTARFYKHDFWNLWKIWDWL